MARTDPQVNIRIPADLKERIEKAAPEANRSMNAEIVARLEASFSASADQSRLESMLIDLQTRHHDLLAEYTRFLEADKTLQIILKPLAVKYGSELVRVALREMPESQYMQIKAALAAKDEAWVGKVISVAVEAVEARLRQHNAPSEAK